MVRNVRGFCDRYHGSSSTIDSLDESRTNLIFIESDVNNMEELSFIYIYRTSKYSVLGSRGGNFTTSCYMRVRCQILFLRFYFTSTPFRGALNIPKTFFTYFAWQFFGRTKTATCCVTIISKPLRIASWNNVRCLIDNFVSHGSPKNQRNLLLARCFF